MSDSEFSAILKEVSIYPGELLNFNLMTPVRIGIVSGSQHIISDVLEYRNTKSFVSKEEVKKLTGIVDQNILERLSFYPSKHTITRTFCERNLGENIQSVSLTPDSNFAPWELDYYLNLAESQTLDENLLEKIQKIIAKFLSGTSIFRIALAPLRRPSPATLLIIG